jgi:hypothetical protein
MTILQPKDYRYRSHGSFALREVVAIHTTSMLRLEKAHSMTRVHI